MKIHKRKVAHRDARGTLTDIFDETPVKSCVLVTQKKGTSRGNHYHGKTTQYTYVLKGKLRFYSQKPESAKVESAVIRTGDFVVSPPGHAHEFFALEDSVLLAFAEGPRGGKSYESDTHRLGIPLHEAIRKRRK